MVDSQRGAERRVGYNHLISNKREWNNCFVKNALKISMNLPDFILLEQTGKSLIFILQVTLRYVIENLNIENVTFCEDH